jgi:glutamate racemase
MTKLRNEGPIGVFDSGLAGLRVMRAISDRLPREDIVYLGDTARVPYGTRSAQTVVNYAHACARTLREQHIKILVVACNTLSAVALDALAGELLFPVLGSIMPNARAAVQASSSKRIGVIASSRTVLSGAYPRALAIQDPEAQVFVQAAPLLISLVEEGWLHGEVPRLAVREYLAPLAQQDIDTLILGSTHYPLLMPLIESEYAALSGKRIAFVDSAQAAANDVVRQIESKQLATARADPGKLRIILTDLPNDFQMASRFLGEDVTQLKVSAVDI